MGLNRGYYRCSTSKGCSAKKQVERCRTDASMLIITYTSSHNHPSPGGLPLHATNQTQSPKEPQTTDGCEDEQQQQQKQEAETEAEADEEITENENMKRSSRDEEEQFHYLQSPLLRSPQNILIINQEELDPFSLEKNHEKLEFVLDEEPLLPCSDQITTVSSSPTGKSEQEEENDFFDELEELPIPSAFTSFMRSKFLDEGIPVVPS